MIHHHGTPITPRERLLTMAGKHFCVPFSDPRDADVCVQIAQSIMWDNGAFSFYTRGLLSDWSAFYAWLESRLAHPHWAVVPDVIGGTVEDQRRLIDDWPHGKQMAATVWHMGMPVEYLLRLIDAGWGKVCFGSSAQYWQVGSDPWRRRADFAWNEIARRHRPLPWIHMLRGLSLGGDIFPFASADSSNVARNYKSSGRDPELMARQIDGVQCPIRWQQKAEQLELIA